MLVEVTDVTSITNNTTPFSQTGYVSESVLYISYLFIWMKGIELAHWSLNEVLNIAN